MTAYKKVFIFLLLLNVVGWSLLMYKWYKEMQPINPTERTLQF